MKTTKTGLLQWKLKKEIDNYLHIWIFKKSVDQAYWDKIAYYAKIYRGNWKALVQDKIAEFMDALLGNGGNIDGSMVEDFITQISALTATFGDSQKKTIDKFFGYSYSTGKADLVGEKPPIAESDKKVLDALVKNQVFYMNNMFDRTIADGMREKIMEQVVDGGLTGQDAIDAIKTILDEDLTMKPENYLNMLADVDAERATTFGKIEEMDAQGIKYFKIVNPLDHRTSDICRHLVKVYDQVPVQLALDKRDEYIENDDPEAIGDFMPWPTKDQLDELDAEELMALGVLMPPFHSRCRSTIEPAQGPTEEEDNSDEF
jgi:hypothetical protein